MTHLDVSKRFINSKTIKLQTMVTIKRDATNSKWTVEIDNNVVPVSNFLEAIIERDRLTKIQQNIS